MSGWSMIKGEIGDALHSLIMAIPQEELKNELERRGLRVMLLPKPIRERRGQIVSFACVDHLPSERMIWSPVTPPDDALHAETDTALLREIQRRMDLRPL